ncbi:MAG TPA: hypothetical protein VLI90_03335 [Tepidisphaeraceae bacterium]|nr:hypothetical protein [Tepidisphaeraceae bacterium]
MSRSWFKAKRFGWGWTPTTWQGWFVMAAFVAAVTTSAFGILGVGKVMTIHQWVAFYAALALEPLILVLICCKTGERPRWRWGTHDESR